MEMKKIRAAEEKAREREEEAKLERRIQEQQERMRAEFEEEQNKKKAKELAVSATFCFESRNLTLFSLWCSKILGGAVSQIRCESRNSAVNSYKTRRQPENCY